MNATLPALSAARGAAGLSVSAGDSSSSAIVPVAETVLCPPASDAWLAALRVNVTVSSSSSSRSSSMIGTSTVRSVAPAANVSVPLVS